MITQNPNGLITVKLLEVFKQYQDTENAGKYDNRVKTVKVNGTALDFGEDKDVNIDLSDYATTDAVNTAIANADHLKRRIVESAASIDTTATDADRYIYLVPNTDENDPATYDEYMVTDGALNKVGDWNVDLSDYVTKEEGKGLSENDFTAAYKAQLDNLSADFVTASTADILAFFASSSDDTPEGGE